MKGHDVSFLRKQESRWLWACYGVPPGHTETLTVWIPAFAGNDTMAGLGFASAGLSPGGKGGWLHSAKMLPKPKYSKVRLD